MVCLCTVRSSSDVVCFRTVRSISGVVCFRTLERGLSSYAMLECTHGLFSYGICVVHTVRSVFVRSSVVCLSVGIVSKRRSGFDLH